MSEWRDYSQPAAPDPASLTAEERRLQEARAGVPWRAWGPYLSERQWGTVREDYSDNGDAWSYFSHDQARSRAYRWGEDGIAGISDDKQRLCLALALWNERDPILKERLFGLTNAEGNHGEDVKEYYFYVDNVPTHSYQRYLYKYPQAAFPYNDLVTVNRSRSRHEFEYELIARRRAEADEFYDAITPPAVSDDAKSVMRQALAGMLWSKQCYYFDVDRWLRERNVHPLRAPTRRGTRNESWFHMFNHDVVSMPDKWEYPWYAAWDLAFHCIPLAMVDPDFAKSQLDLMLSQDYLHSSGQMPAYEWNFGDVNPPVHAFATLFLENLEAGLGQVDLAFLQESFARLLLNFTWWVNRKDIGGRNVFEGGFLGLDNIGVFDRSAALPTGGRLEQADGTAWIAMFSQNMLELALGLLEQDGTYEGFALKFVEHFFWIAAAVDPIGEHPDEMWDEEDGFFYDVLRLPDGTGTRLKVRSLVGLLPICATTVIEADIIERYPQIAGQVRTFLERNQDLLANIADPLVPGVRGRRILSLVNEEKLRRILARMLDEERFLGPHGIRSISRWHLDHPYTFDVHGAEHRVQYGPAESPAACSAGTPTGAGRSGSRSTCS